MSSPLYRLVDGSKQVQRRSFDPSQITQQQIDEAIAMTDLVLNDETLRDILYRFVKDYAEAQHAIEITEVAGSGAFELILTIIVAAVTGGAGVVAAVGSKMHLVRKFNKVGDLLADFAQATKRIKNRKKAFNGKNTGPGKLESVDGSVKKTDAHGAETGEVSKEKSLEEEFEEVYALAPQAKEEADHLAEEIARKNGGVVAKAPIKSRERALEKIRADYDDDPTLIKDLARNTVVVPAENISAVSQDLKNAGAKVKVIDPNSDPLGYSGVNSTIKTSNGLTAEVQVNSPEMIYAKEPEPIARSILGDSEYDKIKGESTVEGGQGHLYYEEWRSLPENDPKRSSIEIASQDYYKQVRK